MSKAVSKTSPLTFIITASPISAKGDRADRILASQPELPSRSQLKGWFSEGRIRRGSEKLTPSSKVFEGDEIVVFKPVERPSELEPKKMPLEIFFEDEFLMVFYKPRGISMHPGAGSKSEITIANALAAHSKNLSKRSGEFRPGIVHRLDKDTEGLVVVAKNDEVHEALSQQFQSREIARRYWALVWGKFPLMEMKIEAPIGRHPKQRKKMAIVSRGKPATTIVRGIKNFDDFTWVECRLLTGRTHQIRVHLSHKKFPVLNDPVYSRPKKLSDPRLQGILEKLKGQALVAFELGFTHPMTKEKLHFALPPPRWLELLTGKFSSENSAQS